jgi:hypothetical protein
VWSVPYNRSYGDRVHRKCRLGGLPLLAICAASVSAGVRAAELSPEILAPRRINIIDFYGLRSLDAEVLRKALPIHEGDTVSMTEATDVQKKVEAALSGLPHVRQVRGNFTCCDEKGGLVVFIGVQEDTATPLHFRPPPTGDVRLPDELIAADDALEQALLKAIVDGRGQEDDSLGHALQKNAPEARALQEQRVALTASHLDLLRRVLRESANGRQRAMAARYLGYAQDKQAVVDDLVYAAGDPYEEVRNDAVRALLVFAHAKNPQRVPYAPFIDLLDSPVWTDLNKASGALGALTVGRDPELLAMLRRRSLPALVTMARWRDRGHAQDAYMILGRIAGYSDSDLMSRWTKGDAEPVIAAALAQASTPSSAR